jgi:Uma2 family endonuclease
MRLEDFLALPDKPGKQEFLDGEIIDLPPAKRLHTDLAFAVAKLLDSTLDALHQRGIALNLDKACVETGYRLSQERCLQPDVSINHKDQPHGDYYEGSPALAIEIVSESNTARHLEMKVRAYLDAGAVEVWLIYPEWHVVWVHRRGTDTAVRKQGSLTTELLPGVTIDLDRLFE